MARPEFLSDEAVRVIVRRADTDNDGYLSSKERRNIFQVLGPDASLQIANMNGGQRTSPSEYDNLVPKDQDFQSCKSPIICRI
ncbi:hypothetical protein K1719_041293 [Acacia pycnantha]|nr:hypothetical protein K1719_041293 [Acacia pycnantha]